MSSLAQYQLPIGIEVEVPNNRKGILKYVGKVDTKPGLFAGIQLTDGSSGRNNGDFKSVSYFTVDIPLSGIFYSYESIARLNESKLPKKSTSLTNSRLLGQTNINRRVVSSGSVSGTTISTPINGRASPLSRSYSSSRGSRSLSNPYMSQSISSAPSGRRYGTSTITEESESAETSFSNPLSRPGSSASNGSRPSSRADVKPLNGSGIRQITSSASFRASNNSSRNSCTRSLDILSPSLPISPQSSLYGSQNDAFNQVKTLNTKCETLLLENSNLSAEVIHYKTELENTVGLLDEYKDKINEDLCPVIEEYQILLDQKENRIAKLKQSSEKQKNDLRNAITILEEQTIENEKLYQHEINNLKQKLANPDQVYPNDLSEKDKQIKFLSDQIEQLKLDASTSLVTYLESSLAENDAIVNELKANNLELKLELSNLQKHYADLQVTLEECIDDKKTKINSLRKNFALELEEKSKQIIMLNNVMNDTFNDLSRTMDDSDSDDNDEKINELEDQNRFVESKLLESRKTVDSQTSKIAELSSMLEESKKTVESQTEQIAILKSRVSELESLIVLKDEEINSLKRKNTGSIDINGTVPEKFISEENDSLKDQLRQKESLVLQKNLEIDNLRTQLLENSEKNANEKSRELDTYAKKLHKKIDELEYAISNYKTNNETLNEENRKLSSDLEELNSENSTKLNTVIEELKQKNLGLEASVKNMQNLESEVQQNCEKISKLTENNSHLQAKLEIVNDEFNKLTNSKIAVQDLNENLEIENQLLKLQVESLKKNDGLNKSSVLNIERQEPDQKEKVSIIDETIVEPTVDKTVYVKETGSLPIYKPSTTTDPAKGRNKWCGLCEREGHDSYECPFEKDL